MESLAVTLEGQPFGHLLYHFVLTHSNWEHVSLCFSESFASLSEGMQNALWELGGVPRRHRTDRMTLAVNHEGNTGERYTARYQALLHHYGLRRRRPIPRVGSRERRLRAGASSFEGVLEQALLLRGKAVGLCQPGSVLAVRARWWWARSGTQHEAGVCGRELSAVAAALPACRLETQEQRRGAGESEQHDPGEGEHLLGAGSAADRRNGAGADWARRP